MAVISVASQQERFPLKSGLLCTEFTCSPRDLLFFFFLPQSENMHITVVSDSESPAGALCISVHLNKVEPEMNGMITAPAAKKTEIKFKSGFIMQVIKYFAISGCDKSVSFTLNQDQDKEKIYFIKPHYVVA